MLSVLVLISACKKEDDPEPSPSAGFTVSKDTVAVDEFPSPKLQTNAVAFMPDFQEMTKASCAACHVRADAGQDCLTCHNYHVHR